MKRCPKRIVRYNSLFQCELVEGHKGKHQALISWEDKENES